MTQYKNNNSDSIKTSELKLFSDIQASVYAGKVCSDLNKENVSLTNKQKKLTDILEIENNQKLLKINLNMRSAYIEVFISKRPYSIL
jgi:hypothetical protein